MYFSRTFISLYLSYTFKITGTASCDTHYLPTQRLACRQTASSCAWWRSTRSGVTICGPATRKLCSFCLTGPGQCWWRWNASQERTSWRRKRWLGTTAPARTLWTSIAGLPLRTTVTNGLAYLLTSILWTQPWRIRPWPGAGDCVSAEGGGGVWAVSSTPSSSCGEMASAGTAWGGRAATLIQICL